MRISIYCVAILLTTAILAACEVEQPAASSIVVADTISGPEPEIMAIKQAGDRFLAALQEKDLDGMIEEFTDDAVLIPQGHPILTGKPAIRVFYQSQLDQFELDAIGPSLHELVIFGDWAFSRGTVAIVGQLKAQDRKVWIFNRGMEIWKKQPDGSWKIARAVGNGSS